MSTYEGTELCIEESNSAFEAALGCPVNDDEEPLFCIVVEHPCSSSASMDPRLSEDSSSNLFSLTPNKPHSVTLVYKTVKARALSAHAVMTPFIDSDGGSALALLVLKPMEVTDDHKGEDAIVEVLQRFLESLSFQKAADQFLAFLREESGCIQSSLWWRPIYATKQTALAQVSRAGCSEVLSVSTEELLSRQLIKSVSPSPGFVLHHLEKESVFALPLFVEDEIKGVVFLVFPVEASQLNLSRYSHFLGRTLGLKLEHKFLSQTLSEWVSYSPEPLIISDACGVIYRSNKALEKLLGYSQDHFTKGLGEDNHSIGLDALVHPDDRGRFKAVYRSLEAGDEALFEGRCLTSEANHPVHVSWKMRRAPHQDRIYHVIQDISHEHSLGQSLEQAYELANMGTWELDVEKGHVFWSEVTRHIHEEDAPDYQPQLETGINYYHPEDRPAIASAVQRCIETGESWDLQLRIITAKGNERWVRTVGESRFKADQRLYLFGTFIDIDAKKRAELTEEKQAQMLTLLNNVVHQQFLEKSWQQVLPQALQSYTEVLEGNLMMYIHGTQAPVRSTDLFLPSHIQPPSHRVQEELFTLSRPLLPTVFKSYEVTEMPVNHLSHYFKSLSLCSVSMLPVFSGRVFQGVFVIGRSSAISSDEQHKNRLGFIQTFAYSLSQAIAHQQSLEILKAVNAELAENMNALAHSNQELEQFAYIASHDLQEPLRMVTSFLDQLEKKYAHALDEKAHRYIFFATDGARRMRQIILDLLEYSRLGKPEQMVYETISSEDLMAEVNALLSQKIKETGAQIVYDFPPSFLAPRIPLRQVLQNLVGNALKYSDTKRPPQINIVLKTDQNLLFSVQDNGIGIESDYFKKIFIIFQRLHGKDAYEGTGVGLALCKKIIEQCQGTIWLESVLDQGSTFYFQIPKGE